MTIDADAPLPPYLQLAETLRAAIQSEDLAPGAKLPSGRVLAGTYGVALNTAQKAVEQLQRDGLVQSHGTRGVYVRGGQPDRSAPKSPGEVAELRQALAELASRVAALESERQDR